MKLCIPMLSRAAEPQFQSGLNPAVQRELLEIVKRAVARAEGWKPPSNWSAVEWARELEQVAFVTALEAARDYAPGNTTFGAFSYQKIISKIRVWCDREWRFARHLVHSEVSLESDHDPGPFWEALPSVEAGPDKLTERHELRVEVAMLPQKERSLLLRLYWLDATEAQEAKALGVSQCAINRRKQTTLRKLSRRLDANGSARRPFRRAAPKSSLNV